MYEVLYKVWTEYCIKYDLIYLFTRKKYYNAHL